MKSGHEISRHIFKYESFRSKEHRSRLDLFDFWICQFYKFQNCFFNLKDHLEIGSFDKIVSMSDPEVWDPVSTELKSACQYSNKYIMQETCTSK